MGLHGVRVSLIVVVLIHLQLWAVQIHRRNADLQRCSSTPRIRKASTLQCTSW